MPGNLLLHVELYETPKLQALGGMAPTPENASGAGPDFALNLDLYTSCFARCRRQWCRLHSPRVRLPHQAVQTMFLPRELIAHLYNHLARSHHAQSPPVLLLVALEPDALCACRILTALLKRDYISHNIIPVSGYGDLARAGETQVQPMRTQNGGSGGTVICLGVGGLVDLGTVLGLEATEDDEDATGGVEVWVIDARRPWNLGNVFGGKAPEVLLREGTGNSRVRLLDVSRGQIQKSYRPGRGGVIVYDDGDIRDELETEREAYFQLEQLPPIDDDGQESDRSETESEGEDPLVDSQPSKKRKAWSEAEEDTGESGEENERPRQRRRSNSVSSDGSMLQTIAYALPGGICCCYSKSAITKSPTIDLKQNT